MATKKYWLGSNGPFLYDNTKTDQAGRAHVGFHTEGTAIVDTAPATDTQVVRLVDLNLVQDEAYSQLVAAADLNLGTGGAATVNLLTIPAATLLLPLRIIVHVTALSGAVSVVPIISLGKSTSAAVYMDTEELFGLNTVNQAFVSVVGGNLPVLVALDILMLTVDTQADITDFDVDVYIYGATLTL